MLPIPTATIVAAFVVVNIGIAVIGYYVGVRHVDRLLDIEEGEANTSFPPGFGDRKSERIGPLSAEDIDEISEWKTDAGPEQAQPRARDEPDTRADKRENDDRE